MGGSKLLLNELFIKLKSYIFQLVDFFDFNTRPVIIVGFDKQNRIYMNNALQKHLSFVVGLAVIMNAAEK